MWRRDAENRFAAEPKPPAPMPPKVPHRSYTLEGLRKCPFLRCERSFSDCVGEECSAFRLTKFTGNGKARCTCLRLERSAYDEYTVEVRYDES